jgi:hypothetical protein
MLAVIMVLSMYTGAFAQTTTTSRSVTTLSEERTESAAERAREARAARTTLPRTGGLPINPLIPLATGSAALALSYLRKKR